MAFEKQRGSPRGEAGQILLVVILVVIVASTVGLSIATRSITSLRTSTEEAESQKALAAAETGIERALQGSTPIGVSDSIPSNNSSYSTEVDLIDSSKFLINGGNLIPKDEGADVWFVSHDNDGNPDYSSMATFNGYFNLYWGSASEICDTPSAPAAIEAIVVSRNESTGDVTTYRYTYDSCPNRASGNNFTQADSAGYTITIDTVDGPTPYTFKNRTNPENSLAGGISDIVFIRVIPIYKDAVIAVSACDHVEASCTSLPTQGYKVSSTGISGQANRKLTVFKGYPQTYLPFLSYGLFVAN